MKQALKDLFSSKKFLLTLAGILAYVAGRLGLNLSTEQLLPVLGLIAVLIGAQGVADHGKEAAKVEAAENEKARLLE